MVSFLSLLMDSLSASMWTVRSTGGTSTSGIWTVIVEDSELPIVSTELYVPFLTESSLSSLLAGTGDVGRLGPCHPRTFGVG